MLIQEWDWEKAMEINARDAAREASRETEKRMNEQWEAVVAEKDAEIATLKAKLEEAEQKNTAS